MSFKDILSPSSILFLVGGVYFAVIAAAQEGSIYSVIASILAFVSFGLSSFRTRSSFVSPWRIASALFIVVLLAAQVIADSSVGISSGVVLGGAALNIVLLIVFLGVLLASLYDIVKKEEKEEDEEGKPAKKLTYEI